ncbi:MAG: hypothetical protein ACRENH_14680 [Gemmatimonadaceae bacterium]
MRRFVSCAAILALTALSACGNDTGVGPGIPLVFQTPSPTTSTAGVVGTWTRSVSFVDEFGATKTTETTWVFNADGSATRTITVRSSASGPNTTTESTARWQVQGDQVAIDFVTPSPARVTLQFSRVGDSLILGGETFLRAL